MSNIKVILQAQSLHANKKGLLLKKNDRVLADHIEMTKSILLYVTIPLIYLILLNQSVKFTSFAHR